MANLKRGPGKLTTAKVKLAEEICSHLSAYGGAAHRDVVIERILAGRQLKDGASAVRMRRLALSAFDLHHKAAAEVGAPKLFTLPFGEGSHRWALDREEA